MLRKAELNEALNTWTKKFGRLEDHQASLSSAYFYTSDDEVTHRMEDLLKCIKGQAKEMQIREREAIWKLRAELSLRSLDPDRVAEARARYGPDTLTYTLHRLGAILWEGDLDRIVSLAELEEVSAYARLLTLF